MPVSTWMTTLQKTLAGEGLLAEPQGTCRVPRQCYARDLAEFTTHLRRFVRSVSRPGDRITLFVDGTPKKCSDKGGSDLDRAFCETLRASGLAVDRVVLSDLLGIPTPDFHASHVYIEKTREVIRSFKPVLALVLGSGSITDVVKQAIFLENLGTLLISIPTALTVTAFTSTFSVIDYRGVKRTQLSRRIAATFWVKSILECAPPRMSRAGYGDLLARFVAYGDWYLGKRLGVMERYDERAFRLMEPFSRGIQENSRGFSSDPLPAETIECISASLAMAGIAMSVSGETTPLSGFEHVISHGLDFLRLSSGRELVFHGVQVGLGCLTSAKAIDWLLATKNVGTEGWLENPGSDDYQAPCRCSGRSVGKSPQGVHRGIHRQGPEVGGRGGCRKETTFCQGVAGNAGPPGPDYHETCQYGVFGTAVRTPPRPGPDCSFNTGS